MNKSLLIGVLALAASNANAAFSCLPKELGGSGSNVHTVRVTAPSVPGKGHSWTCPGAPVNTIIVMDSFNFSGTCSFNAANFFQSAAGTSQADVLKFANDLLSICQSVPTEAATLNSYRTISENLINFWRAPTVSHTVKPNGVLTWRYTFPVTPAGTRGLTYNGRVNVGTACNGSVRTITELGSNTWMAFGPAFNPNVVTLCSSVVSTTIVQ